jgi:hypothetical protein
MENPVLNHLWARPCEHAFFKETSANLRAGSSVHKRTLQRSGFPVGLSTASHQAKRACFEKASLTRARAPPCEGMSGGRRRGPRWSLPPARSKVLGKLGPSFGAGAGCGVGVGVGLIGGSASPLNPRPAHHAVEPSRICLPVPVSDLE